MSQDFVLRGGMVVRPGHAPEELDLLIRDGRFAGGSAKHPARAKLPGTHWRWQCLGPGQRRLPAN